MLTKGLYIVQIIHTLISLKQAVQLQDGYSFVAHQDAPDPVAYYFKVKNLAKAVALITVKSEMIYKKVDTEASTCSTSSS